MRAVSVLCTIAFITIIPLVTINAQGVKRDSVMITTANNTQILIYGKERKELEKILNYDLDKLLKDFQVSVDTLEEGSRFIIKNIDGVKYLKDTVSKANYTDHIVLDLRGTRQKGGNTEVRITIRSQGSSDLINAEDIEGASSAPLEAFRKLKKISKMNVSPRKGLELKFGLNLYAKNDPKGYNEEDYDLRPGGSRFVSLGVVQSARIAKGKNLGFHLDYGLDFSWYNMMYDGNNTVKKESGGQKLEYPVLTDVNGNELALSKSKLTLSYLNISLMPTLSIKDFLVTYLSAGGYAGYRLTGYTKTKAASDGDKAKHPGNYFSNDFRYGLSFELGLRNLPDLFVHYDLNALFQEDRAPGISMLSFGIRL